MDWFVKKEKLLLTIIFIWIVFVALWHLPTNPPSWFDEGIFHQVITSLVNNGRMSVQLAPGVWSESALISVGYPVFYPAVAAFYLFNDSVLVLRLVAVAFLFGLVIFYYRLAKTVYGTRSAILSLLLLALFSPLYGNGKNFLGEVPGLFYFVTALSVLAVAENMRRRELISYRRFFIAGLFFGLAAASKPNFLVIIPAIICAFLWQWRWSLGATSGRRAFFVTGLGVALPLIFWAFTQFTGATSSSQIFAHYSNPYYINDFWPIISRNLQRFFTESTPAHFLFLAIAALYLLYVKVWQRRPLALVEITVVAFVGAIFLFYVRTAGWYRYFFPAHVMLFIFLPQALEYFFTSRAGRYASVLLVSAVAGLAIFQTLPMIQERFHSGADVPTLFQPVLDSVDSSENALFYSLPQLAARFHGSNYAQYIKMSDHLALGEDNLARLRRGEFSLVFMEAGVDASAFSCYNLNEILYGIRILRRIPSADCP
ncbi:MAG: glycosyltransferase family 39 protein [bacterium]|nr:glycosyltransferase family 39 protein [bacterium]